MGVGLKLLRQPDNKLNGYLQFNEVLLTYCYANPLTHPPCELIADAREMTPD